MEENPEDVRYDEVHHSVRKRFGETLTYFFLALGPIYEHRKVIEALDELFENQQVQSRAYFEVYGEVDFIVRAWLPGTKLSDFSVVLENFLMSRGCGVKYVNQFTVASNPYHWLFSDLKPRARFGEGESELLDQTTVEEINSVLRGGDESNVRGALREKLLGLHLMAPAERIQGVRFFVGIPTPGGRIEAVILNALVEDISTVLRSASLIEHSVAYRGATGQEIMLLIEGIASKDHFDSIDDAVTAMNEAGLRRFKIKTVTYLTTRSDARRANGKGGVANSETLIDPKDIHDARYYLQAEEGHTFERKATYELDLGRFLAKGEQEPNPKIEDEVLGTIVGFLNADGGDILIGAAEENSFRGELQEKLRSFPAASDGLRICGVAWEYKFTKNKNWESYENKLRERFSHRIGRSRLPYIRVKHLRAENKELAVIQVQALPPEESAYLDNDKFYVRQGPATSVFTGQDRDGYQNWRRARGRDEFFRTRDA